MSYLVSYQMVKDGPWTTSMRYASVDEAIALARNCTPPRPHAVRVEHEPDEPGWANANAWFGEAWPYPYYPAPICDDFRLHIATPDHEDCQDCGEPITPTDSGTRMPFLDVTGPRMVYQHAECGLRAVMCPIDLGLVEDPTGQHKHDPTKRREEAKLLMEMSRSRRPV